MTYKTMAVITAIVGFVLGVGYLLAGALVVGRWQIEPTESVLLLGRRMGILYLGLALMFFLARSAPVSAARTALSAGAAVVLTLLPLVGVYELAVGHAGPGILVSIVGESLLAIGFIRILYVERRDAVKG